MSLAISHWVHIHNGKLVGHQRPAFSFAGADPVSLYSLQSYNYPKFFKMDVLCKWAWLGAEHIFSSGAWHADIDKTKIAVVLATSHGCIDVDKKYAHTIAGFPSPALFVYTLPNIMLGEICIRHGFKGEQLCLVNESMIAAVPDIWFWANDLLENRGMDACLCGWVNATAQDYDICMFYITKQKGMEFTPAAMQQLYHVD